MVSIQVDYSEAGVPDQYYVADFYSVDVRNSTVIFVFGKIDLPDETKLRNKIEIFFPVHTFIAQLWASSRDFHAGLRDFISKTGPAAQRCEDQSVVQQMTSQVRTLQSNNVMMARGGGESILDFFYISPKDLWIRPKRSEQIGLEPIVRVILPPVILLGWLDRCGEIVESVKTQVHPDLLANSDSPSEGNHEGVESRETGRP